MKVINKSYGWDLYQRAIHHLILNTPYLNDLGLLNGKMGIALVFYLLSRKLEDEVYADYAADVLDGIFDGLQKNTLIDFDSGLCGIGWGIEYLIQNQFVEGQSFEICEEIDKRIVQIDPRRIESLSLENGLCGLLHYILIHIKGCFVQKAKIPFDIIYLSDLYKRVKELKIKNKEISILKNMYIDYMEKDIVPQYSFYITFFRNKRLKIRSDKLIDYPLGLRTGLAGTII